MIHVILFFSVQTIAILKQQLFLVGISYSACLTNKVSECTNYQYIAVDIENCAKMFILQTTNFGCNCVIAH